MALPKLILAVLISGNYAPEPGQHEWFFSALIGCESANVTDGTGDRQAACRHNFLRNLKPLF